MDKANLVGGAVYMRRDGVPVRLISTRIYSGRNSGGKTVYDVAPAEVTSARRDPRDGANRVDYGYLTLAPERPRANSDEALRDVPIHELTGPDELPLTRQVPTGFVLELLTNCAALKGEYHIVRAAREAETEARRAAEQVARDRYNDLVRAANKKLDNSPLRTIERESDAVPTFFSLTPAQLARLIDYK